MPPHKSKSNSIAFVEGQQNGADDASPLRFLLRGRTIYLFRWKGVGYLWRCEMEFTDYMLIKLVVYAVVAFFLGLFGYLD